MKWEAAIASRGITGDESLPIRQPEPIDGVPKL
jgi:hypothetical protein